MREDNYWKRHHRRGLTRRAFLGGAGFTSAGLASLALTGCGDEGSDGGTRNSSVERDAGGDPAAPASEESAHEGLDSATVQHG